MKYRIQVIDRYYKNYFEKFINPANLFIGNNTFVGLEAVN